MKIKIDGAIGWDITARDISRQLKRAGGNDIEVEISSPGGSIYEGLIIFNDLKNYDGNLTFRITGMAASMATYIMLARGAENITVEKNAVIMIHNAQGWAGGDYRELGHMTKLLDDLTGHLAKTYSEVTGKTVEDVRALLDATTYIYGEDIATQGFAGSVVDSVKNKDVDEPAALALAKMAVGECMAKVKEHEISAQDIKDLSTMVMKMSGSQEPPATPASAVDNNPEPMEENNMDLKELQAKHPDLCASLINEGHEKGVADERARAKQIIAFRAKFPGMHVVIDEAVAEGHDLMTLNLNIMSAQGVAAEVDAAKGEGIKVPAAGNPDAGVPEMVDGVMTTQEHLDTTSKTLANMIGLNVQ